MTVTFRFSLEADQQIRAAARWWIENRTKAPTAFVDELDTALRLIEQLPYAGESVPNRRIHGLRRVLLGRVHYHLYYVVAEEAGAIDILSLWHTSRGRGPRL